MINELLSLAQTLLQYSLLLSLQLLFILLVRKPVARWLGAANAYRLWLLPLLWLPFFIVDLPAQWRQWGAGLSSAPIADSTGAGSVSWYAMPLQTWDYVLELAPFQGNFISIQTEAERTAWLLGCSLWLTVMVILLLLQVRNILDFSRQFRALQLPPCPGTVAVPALKRLRVHYLPGLGSPAIFGVLRPRLLLPADFDTQYGPRQRELILAHEAVHYRRSDNFWNLVATGFRIVFWFNPLVHLAWRPLRLDQEMSCDEIALRSTDPDEGKQYARTLLDSMSRAITIKHQPTLTAWGNLREIRERTHMIRHHLSTKPRSGLGLLLLLGIVLAGSLSSEVLTQSIQRATAAESNQQALRREVYEQIEQVMALHEEENQEAAKAILDELHAREDLTTRERATVLQLLNANAVNRDSYDEAIGYQETLMDLEGLNDGIREQTTMNLGQLYFAVEDYEQSIALFTRYLEEYGTDNAEVPLRIAYALYQLERFEEAVPYLEQHLALDTAETPSRNTYSLLRAIYLTLENYEAANRVNEVMVDLYGEADDERLAEQLSEQLTGQTEPPEEAVTRQEYLPIVTVAPEYPGRGLQRGIEGFAVVEFTVDEQGSVTDPVIVDANPERVFDRSSLEAIDKFKFNPRMENGVAVATEGVRYVFRYELTDSEY